MSLTLDLDNRRDMLRKILVSMLYLSRKGMVQCIWNKMTIQVLDEQRMTMVMLRLKFDNFNCCLEEGLSHIVCINLINLSHIVASHCDESVTVNGNARTGSIHFEFSDIGGDGARSVITQTIHPPENWMVINMLMSHLFVYKMAVMIPSEEIRRALVHLDSPILIGPPTNLAVVVHVNGQIVRFTTREQSVEVHGCVIFGIQQDEQFVIRMTFKHIKSYIAASKFSDVVWLFKSLDVSTPDMLVCRIIVEGVWKGTIAYHYFKRCEVCGWTCDVCGSTHGVIAP